MLLVGGILSRDEPLDHATCMLLFYMYMYFPLEVKRKHLIL